MKQKVCFGPHEDERPQLECSLKSVAVYLSANFLANRVHEVSRRDHRKATGPLLVHCIRAAVPPPGKKTHEKEDQNIFCDEIYPGAAFWFCLDVWVAALM